MMRAALLTSIVAKFIIMIYTFLFEVSPTVSSRITERPSGDGAEKERKKGREERETRD